MQLGKILCVAEDNGYLFSNYRYEGKPANIKREDLPKFIHLSDDGKVEYYGTTTLTDGQMKTIVEQAGVIIVRIMKSSDHWFCLYQTFIGLKGIRKVWQSISYTFHIRRIWIQIG